MSVTFTQYLMPNRRRTTTQIDLDEEAEAKAKVIQEKGFVFECEMLSDYSTCSFTITHPTLDDGEPFDVACELAQNGPAVPIAVKKLIMDFDPNKDYSLD